MRKGLIAFCLILLALTIGIAVKPSRATPETAVVSVDPAKLNLTTAYVGQTIQLNVSITNVQGLWGWALQNVNFDPKVLKVTNVQEGPFLKSQSQTFFLWASNSTLAFSEGDIPEINCAFGEDTTVNGTGVLATLSFKVVAAGTSPISIGAAALMSDIASNQLDENNEISCTWTNGTVTVTTVSSATPTPGLNSPTPTSSFVASAPSTPPTLTPDGHIVGIGASDASNMYIYIGIIVVVASAASVAIVVVRRRR
jgi:hypothetical protein